MKTPTTSSKHKAFFGGIKGGGHEMPNPNADQGPRGNKKTGVSQKNSKAERGTEPMRKGKM